MAKKALARIDEGDTAAAVAVGCAALLDAGLAEQLGPATAEEEGLDCGGRLAVRSARRLQGLKHNLEVCREALARIRDELRPWRRRRERAHEALYDATKDIRRFCRGIFVDGDGDSFLGLHGSLPREPKELYAACNPVIGRLADAEWPLPKQRVGGFEIKRDKLVESMIRRYNRLGEALAAIKEGETREAVAQAAKNRASEVHAAFLAKSSRFLESALELAGLGDLAATVRPNVGRRGRPARKALAAVAVGLPGEAKALPSGLGRARLPAAESPADAVGAGSESPPSEGGGELPDASGKAG